MIEEKVITVENSRRQILFQVDIIRIIFVDEFSSENLWTGNQIFHFEFGNYLDFTKMYEHFGL